MAKTNMVEREKRRAKIVKQYAAKRAQLKELIRSPNTSPEEREKAQVKLQSSLGMPVLRGSGIAVPSRAAHAAYIGNLACRV